MFHHPLIGAMGMVMIVGLWVCWLCWAMLVGSALVTWWMCLSMFLAGRWVVFTAITAYADRPGMTSGLSANLAHYGPDR